MSNSFVKRRIDLTFYLGKGKDASEGVTVVEVKELRCQAQIVTYGGTAMGEAHIRVWGLSLDLMNQISAVFPSEVFSHYDRVSVAAGDDVGGMATIFQGGITYAWTEMNGYPDAILNVSAYTGVHEAIKPVAPISYPGSADAAVILAGIAQTAGLGFQNWGASAILSNPYYPGTALDQIQAVCRAAPIEYIIENNTLEIWPKGGARGGLIPFLSPETGLVGYPSYTGGTIGVISVFNPNIRGMAKFKVQSSLTPTCGEWTAKYVVHDISAELPGGSWFTRVEGARSDVSANPR